MPGLPAGTAGTSSLMFATTDSVVSSVDATDVAFCNAVLVTLTGCVESDTVFGLFYFVDDNSTLKTCVCRNVV